MARHTFGKVRVATATRTLPRRTTPNNAERNRTPHLSLDCHTRSNPPNKKHMSEEWRAAAPGSQLPPPLPLPPGCPTGLPNCRLCTVYLSLNAVRAERVFCPCVYSLPLASCNDSLRSQMDVVAWTRPSLISIAASYKEFLRSSTSFPPSPGRGLAGPFLLALTEASCSFTLKSLISLSFSLRSSSHFTRSSLSMSSAAFFACALCLRTFSSY